MIFGWVNWLAAFMIVLSILTIGFAIQEWWLSRHPTNPPDI